MHSSWKHLWRANSGRTGLYLPANHSRCTPKPRAKRTENNRSRRVENTEKVSSNTMPPCRHACFCSTAAKSCSRHCQAGNACLVYRWKVGVCSLSFDLPWSCKIRFLQYNIENMAKIVDLDYNMVSLKIVQYSMVPKIIDYHYIMSCRKIT